VARQVILHRDAEPTIAWFDGRFVEVITPQITPLDERGGGDTFMAALTVGLVKHDNLEETIRFAAAAGTLNVTRHGLGTGRLADIMKVSQHVQIRPLDLTVR
jgi:1-phosphofructokinase